jgi:hypothetical protein
MYDMAQIGTQLQPSPALMLITPSVPNYLASSD